ncbi:MAG TPA: S1 RNA-binding domain-containing protein [Acidimicrobiales bacterium]|nr:S1 RNA-binding domain-containing protein [Acidimicrobiales bacterium]
MSARHVVIDGSNIATEGRSLPSFAQLLEAVEEFRREHPDDIVTVVVDATFGHRIDESELAAFKDAEERNELVSPPAGAIGRGDAFLLRIAERVGAMVLSNDSFQEFHGEHDWLFDKGRLIGGKPVPGVGWIFTPRTPVRGPKSREAVKVAKRAKKTAGEKQETKKVQKAIATAVEEAVEPDSPSAKRRRRRSRGASPPAEPVNAPLTFISFVSAHKLGSEVPGEVDSFSSHGAFVHVDGARCYVPLSAMGAPPPRAAREVLKRGETRTFVVQAFDPPRRGIELALPGFAQVAAGPTEETVEEEIAAGGKGSGKKAARPRKKAADVAAVAAPPAPAPAPAPSAELAAPQPRPEAAPVKRSAAKKAATTRKSAAKKSAPPAKKAVTKKAASPTKKSAPAPADTSNELAAPQPAKKAAPPKKAATKKAAAAKKAAATTTKKSAATKKTAGPAKKSAR